MRLLFTRPVIEELSKKKLHRVIFNHFISIPSEFVSKIEILNLTEYKNFDTKTDSEEKNAEDLLLPCCVKAVCDREAAQHA